MSFWKEVKKIATVYVPAVIGFAAGPAMGISALAGAAAGGGLGFAYLEKEKAAERAESIQQKRIDAEKEMQARQIELAGQQTTLTEKQMELQMGQRQIELLANLFDKQDRTEPEIYYLPTAEPTSPVTRINLAIDDFFRK